MKKYDRDMEEKQRELDKLKVCISNFMLVSKPSARASALFTLPPPPIALAMLAIDHLRVDPSLFPKARRNAKPLIWKWVFILMQIKLIFPRTKVLHLASLWQWECLELGNGQLVAFLWRVSTTEDRVLASKIDVKAILIVLFVGL